MDLGLILFIFLVVLVLVSISPRKKWSLDSEEPLNVDELRWPAAGYGSAAVSLNCLFGAYWATLLLVGPFCFVGVVAGVVTGLFALNWWIYRLRRAQPQISFQSALYGTRFFESSGADHLFWIVLAGCQLGLAISELLLLHNVFSVGMGFSGPHAIAACLGIACVAYYYCLFGGYHALFRTDALQYVFIILMGTILFWLLWREGLPSPDSIGSTAHSGNEADSGAPRLMPNHPRLRILFELVGGFALGIMPVLAAPDAWKRVLIISRKRVPSPPGHNISHTRFSLRAFAKIAPVRLLVVTALPLTLILPIFWRFSRTRAIGDWTFPIRELFQLSPALADGFIVLGMAAAFMSTYDGALLSATHVFLGRRILSDHIRHSELARFRIILAAGFMISFLFLFPLLRYLPNAYVVGAFLVGPFALVSGILIGTRFGERHIRGAFIYPLAPAALLWVLFCLRYLGTPGTDKDPYLAAPLVFLGCCLFFLFVGSSRLLSKAVGASKSGKEEGRR